MNFYKYTTYGWYDGTTQEYVPIQHIYPCLPLLPRVGMRSIGMGIDGNTFNTLIPLMIRSFQNPLFLIQKLLQCLLLDVSLLKKN